MRIPSNKVKDILRFAKQELNPVYEEREIENLSFILFSHFLDWSPAKVLLEKESTVSESMLLNFNFAIKDLKKQKPIQYIIGKTYFGGLDFCVDERVLIPRPETEELIQLIINENTIPEPDILDIGTGSGCIAVCLADKIQNSRVSACDISSAALEVARFNAQKNKVNVEFKEIDILKDSNQEYRKFDIIVSNPPYVCMSEKGQMENNVLLYEPHSALFVEDDDPLLFYRQISLFSLKHFKPTSKLYLEINERFGQEILQLLAESGFQACLFKDINGKDRFVKAYIC